VEEASQSGSQQDTCVYKKADYYEKTITLNPGDRLYLHSDGVIDALNEDAMRFGRQQLVTAIGQTRNMTLKQSISTLKNDIDTWCGSTKLVVDVSILGVEISDANCS